MPSLSLTRHNSGRMRFIAALKPSTPPAQLVSARPCGALKLGRWKVPRPACGSTGDASRPLRLPACHMIFDVTGDLFTHGRQLKQFVLDDRIVGLLGKLPIHGRLVSEIVRP